MATLNTLRTRGALFLSIIIGVALIAFLLGDLATAGSIFQSRKNRVGQIDGKNIDYMEYASKVEEMLKVTQMIYGQSATSAEEQDQVREMTWDWFIRQNVYNPGLRRAGISVGDNEQVDMVRGTYLSPIISMIFSNPETREYNPAALEEFVSRVGDKEQDPGGQLAMVWDYLKDEMVEQRAFMKYASLVQGGVFVSDIETARAVEQTNNSYSGSYVAIPYSLIADSLAPVSSAEVKKYYKAHKNSFKQTPSRELQYVLFAITPPEEEEPGEDGTYSKEYTDAYAAAEQDAYNRARDFVSLAAGSRTKFAEAVSSTNAFMRTATVTEASRDVDNMKDSREIVRWAWNSKAGAISTIFEIDGQYVVAMLTGAKEEGFIDIKEVSSSIASIVRKEKKAAMLAKQIAGKSFDEIAAMDGVNTGEFADVKFDAFYIPGLGVEPAVLGAISAIPAETLSAPIEGMSGVYVVQVNDIATVEDADTGIEDKKLDLEEASLNYIQQNLLQALKESANVKDYRMKFF